VSRAVELSRREEGATPRAEPDAAPND